MNTSFPLKLLPEQPNLKKKVTIISGGTAANALVNVFSSLSPYISYLLPISDNGGSTSELIRVIGGPAIGDLRSRITRLIPDESESLRDLLSYRLPDDAQMAKLEWSEIVEGTHHLWHQVESQCKELIRPFFIHVHVELLKRSRPGKEFHFEKANVGNLFLTGARLFCGSLDSAIELFLRITLVPNTISVLPALNTNFSHHISAQLYDGTIITGQSQISHPSVSSSLGTNVDQAQPHFETDTEDIIIQNMQDTHINDSEEQSKFDSLVMPVPSREHNYSHEGSTVASSISNTNAPPSPDNDQEDAHLPFSHPDLIMSQLHFHKDTNIPLHSPIKRIFYINPYGQEIHPKASNRVIRNLEQSDVIIYSIGSLFTSLIPVVILQGFASAIQDDFSKRKKRIVLLNGSRDRETENMDIIDFVRALVGACLYSELGGRKSIYYNHPNGSGSSIALNHLAKQQLNIHNQLNSNNETSDTSFGSFQRHKQYTNASYAQELLMRSNTRKSKSSSPTLSARASNSKLPKPHSLLGPDYETSRPLSSSISSNAPNYLSNSSFSSQTHLPTDYSERYTTNNDCSETAIDDVYEQHTIDSAVWNKYLTHIIYLKNTPFAPTREQLEMLHNKGIKCIGLDPVYKEDDIQNEPAFLNKDVPDSKIGLAPTEVIPLKEAIYPPEALREALNEIING